MAHQLLYTSSSIEYVLLGIYLALAVLLGLIGNFFVLTASRLYRSVESDGVSIVLIQNLAVADVLCTLFMVVPSFANYCLFTGPSLPGSGLWGQLCVLTGYMSYVPAEAGTLLILLITGYKTCRCAAPFSGVVYQLTGKTTKVLAVCVWVTASLITLLPMVLTRAHVGYDEFLLRCVYDRSRSSFVRLGVYVFATLLPMVVILTLNSMLLKYGCQSALRNHTRNRKAPLTVLCLSGLFVLSSLPYIVYTILTAVYGSSLQLQTLKAFSGFIYYLNLFGNPVIYTLTNARFYGHCKTLMKRRLRVFGSGASEGGNISTSRESRRTGLCNTSSFYKSSRPNIRMSDLAKTLEMEQQTI